MNTDDMLCVGALGPYLCSNTVARNTHRLPPEALEAFLRGLRKSAEFFKKWGVEVCLTGGETADVGDVVRTMLVDVTLTTRMKKSRVIDGSKIAPGDVIVGLSSFGKTTYEEQYNSGIGSNGLTSARHDLLSKSYAKKYPETLEPRIKRDLRYSGKFSIQDTLAGTPLSIGQALLSPTRSYIPIIKPLLEKHSNLVSGLVHCTGGGQTKCLRLGHGINYVKDNLFDPPPLFELIANTSQASRRDMYQVFNMGHRMEVIGDPRLVRVLEELAKPLELEVREIGRCVKSGVRNINQVSIEIPKNVSNGRADGVSNGKADGVSNGKADGVSNGKADGVSNGKADGVSNGKADGVSNGKADGRADGVSNGKADVVSNGKADVVSNGKADELPKVVSSEIGERYIIFQAYSPKSRGF